MLQGARGMAGEGQPVPTSHWPVGDLAASNIFFRPSMPDMASTFLRQSPTSTGRSCRERWGRRLQQPWDRSSSSPTQSHRRALGASTRRSAGKAVALLQTLSEAALLRVPLREADREGGKHHPSRCRELWTHMDTHLKAWLSCINVLEDLKIPKNIFRRMKPAHEIYSRFTPAHWGTCSRTHFL